MDVVSDLDALVRRPRSVAIGTFDGVHVGHRRVIEAAVAVARDRGLTASVLTFAHHPLSVIDPPHQPRLLTPLSLKLELIAELDVDEAVVLPFDRTTAGLAPEEFCARVLCGRLDTRHVAVGANFNFGAGGEGTPARLRRCGETCGFDVEVVPLVRVGGRPISSSRIRRLVESGDLAEARSILGRPPRAVGHVVRGFERGRHLGFPTANVEAETGTLFPGRGVYAARALAGGDWRRAAVNVGHNPTFRHRGDELGIVHVEAFLLDFTDDIYGAPITLDFLAKVRDERRYEFVDDLVEQMQADVVAVRELRDEAFDEVGLGAGAAPAEAP